jgi:serine/threonine-protein kinase
VSPSKPPTKIGPYRIVGRIGGGGMGVVYEAIQQPIERRVAIKVLLAKYAHDRELLTRFFNEARAVNRIEHPSIVQVSEFGQRSDGTAYLVMEYLRGESLTSRLDRLEAAGQQMEVAQVLQLGAQLADALTAAHEKGIVHRDMKPGNVMLVRDSAVPGGERAKILDFGIAKLSDRRSRSTDRDLVIGTPPYMSPEQCRGAGGVDDKTDVYALGIMLYEMLCGRPPFSEESGEGGELLAQHMFKEPPPLLALAPRVPVDVAELVHRLLIKDKARRPAMSETAGELARLLARLSGIVIAVPRPLADLSGDHTISGPGYAPTTLGRSLGETRRSGQRTRWLLLAGAWSVGVLSVVSLGWHFWLRPDGRPSRPAAPLALPAPTPAAAAEVVTAVAPPPAPAAEPPPRTKPARAGGKRRAGGTRGVGARAALVADEHLPARPRIQLVD